MIKKLYKRIEALPTQHAGDIKTKEKFDQLKIMYNKVAGPNLLSANELLAEITTHASSHSDVLFARRSPNIFVRYWPSLFGAPTSTEKMLNEIKKELEAAPKTEPPKF